MSQKQNSSHVKIPAVEWRNYVFSREILNGKFSDSQRLEWTIKSIECGKSYAEKLTREYNTNDTDELARSWPEGELSSISGKN